MFQRLLIERPLLEHVLRMRRTLFFWLLPAVSLSGAVAHVLWLLYWRFRLRLVRREGTGHKIGVGEYRSTCNFSFCSHSSTRLSPATAFGPGPTRFRSFSMKHNNMEFDCGHLLTPSQQLVINRGGCESPNFGHVSKLSSQRPEPSEEKSACALHLELYAFSCIALLLLTSAESLFVSQFQTHPTLMHNVLCRFWPIIYHLIFTFPPAILIFPLFHKSTYVISFKNGICN